MGGVMEQLFFSIVTSVKCVTYNVVTGGRFS